jgi:hypothetical protein
LLRKLGIEAFIFPPGVYEESQALLERLRDPGLYGLSVAVLLINAVLVAIFAPVSAYESSMLFYYDGIRDCITQYISL